MSALGTGTGNARSPLPRRADVVICGASFAGLAAAAELAGSGADVLVLDRYEIGARATSACGIPTEWLRVLGLIELELQRFDELVVHTPDGTSVLELPYTFSTFDYDEVCRALWSRCEAAFEIAMVRGRGAPPASANGGGPEVTVDTNRGAVSAPLVLDALGWPRILGSDHLDFQPVRAPLTRALEVHPTASSDELEVWVDRRYARSGYGWSFPAREEVRVGACSYAPRDHVRKGTDAIAADLGHDSVRYQGNWIPHRLRPPTEAGVFFAGDSAGHCLPLTAEGIRTALYYGLAAGREMRAVFEGRRRRDEALARYARLHESHTKGFALLLFFQRLVPRIPPRLLTRLFRIYKWQPLIDLTFNAYLRLAPPEFAEGSAHDEDRAGEQQADAHHALGAERDLVQAE
jgi:flavin-dependent dehydrogenase